MTTSVRSLSSVVRSQPLAEGARSLRRNLKSESGGKDGTVSGIRDEIE